MPRDVTGAFDDRVTIYHGDCLDVMATLAPGSIDMVLTDLPYGMTDGFWDVRLPLDALWPLWLRALKPKGAIVLTASQPFTSALVLSRPKLFRCEWIWNKRHHSNFANANKIPLKIHESVLVFGEGQTTYNPQKTTPQKPQKIMRNQKGAPNVFDTVRVNVEIGALKYPRSIIEYPKTSNSHKLHPTEKPVALFEYLIRTYSNAGETILDCCAGSGTTGEAALRSGRRAVLIEKEMQYVQVMQVRFAALARDGWQSDIFAGAP